MVQGGQSVKAGLDHAVIDNSNRRQMTDFAQRNGIMKVRFTKKRLKDVVGGRFALMGLLI